MVKFRVDRAATCHYTETATGKKFFSWSQIERVLDPNAFDGIPEEILEAARVRGTTLHHLFAVLLASRAGICPVPSLQDYEDLLGFYTSMERWVDKHKVRPVRLEESSCWRLPGKFGIAGTPDALVKYGLDQILTLPDLKSGGPRPVHRTQVRLYHKFEGYTEARQRLVLYIKKDGGEAEEDWIDPADDAADIAWAVNGFNVLIGRTIRYPNKQGV